MVKAVASISTAEKLTMKRSMTKSRGTIAGINTIKALTMELFRQEGIAVPYITENITTEQNRRKNDTGYASGW